MKKKIKEMIITTMLTTVVILGYDFAFIYAIMH